MSPDLPPVAILCGGLATRLSTVTADTPKSLVPVAGEPFLAHQLRLLRDNGITRVVLCTGHLGEQIRDFSGDGKRFGVSVEYSADGQVLRGTAGAIRAALPLLPARFFVLYGDSYLRCDYAAVLHAFNAGGKPALMTVYRNENRYDASNVEFGAGRIIRYDKQVRTASMKHIDYGLGVFERTVFEQLTASDPLDLAYVYRDLLERGELAGYEAPERFYEIGSPAGLRELDSYLRAAPGARRDAGTRLTNDADA
jgi:NDP-sugar pyrophosphorylase family protein